MPIYEYQCRECSHRLEKLQKLSDAPLTTCPECSRESLTKLVSAAGFRLKGGGWYETDFKKDGKRNLAGDDSSSKSEGGSADSGAKESGKKEAGKADAGTSGSARKEPAGSAGNSGTSKKSSAASAASASSPA